MLLLGAGHCFRDHVLQACPSCLSETGTGRFANQTEGSSLETIRHMVASGVGLSIIPLTAMPTKFYHDDLLVMRPFAESTPTRTVALAWRKGYPRPKAIEVVRNAIVQCDLNCNSLLKVDFSVASTGSTSVSSIKSIKSIESVTSIKSTESIKSAEFIVSV